MNINKLLETIDIEGIIFNCEDEIGVERNIDGFIWNKEDTIDVERLPEVVKSETKDLPKEVSEYVFNSITEELKAHCYI